MDLSEFKIGERLVFRSFAKNSDYVSNLVSLGLLPGTECEIVSLSPFNDMVQIAFRGNSVALRKKEASVLLFDKRVYEE